MKAITIVDKALSEFEAQSGKIPRVIFLPRRIYRQLEQEQAKLAGLLPQGPVDDEQWAHVQVVEHETRQIQVY